MQIFKRRSIHPAEQYCRDILSGKIISNKWIKLACKRHQQDKKNPELFFDYYSAQHVIYFFETFLRHSKGEWANNTFKLEPWEQFILWNIFGWKTKTKIICEYTDNKAETNKKYRLPILIRYLNKFGFKLNDICYARRFKNAYLEVARKNGKSTLLSGIGLYLFFADGEPGAECYSAATKREQALITHSEATSMVRKSPALNQRIKIFRNNLHIEKTRSKFEPLGRDSDSCDGLNIHGALVDELHAHKTRDMWDVLDTATGARRQPLIIAITTAGFDRESICWEQHEWSEKILKNIITDDSFFTMMYSMDQGDNWQDEKLWIKANPNLNITVSLDDLRRKALKASEMPSALNNFLRKHLDVWVQQSTRWIDLQLWEDNFKYPIIEQTLYGRTCFCGLDLSSVSDLTAWVMVFPNPKNPSELDIIARFWCPESRLYDAKNKYRNYYEAWHREGFLNVTPGDAIDYKKVKEQIIIDSKHFYIQSLGVDRLFQGYQLMMELAEEFGPIYIKGVLQERVYACGMGYLTMGPAMRELESRLLLRHVNHGNNPVMKWMADNVAVSTDPAGNKKPNKAESQGKIDGIIALLMALDRQQRNPSILVSSIYENKSMCVI